MISKKMERSEIGEKAFQKELDALNRGIRNMPPLEGSYVEERKKLFKVALSYIDELNKVRKYACPLSTNMLLSSISESLLLSLALRESKAAKRTRDWIRAEKDLLRQGKRLSPEVPILHFAELIQIVHELGLFRTSGIQGKIDAMLIEELELFKSLANTDPDGAESLVNTMKGNSWDVKRNHQMLHRLRNFRNAVHPVRMVTGEKEDRLSDFTTTIWMGLRLLAVLNEMFSIRSSLTQI